MDEAEMREEAGKVLLDKPLGEMERLITKQAEQIIALCDTVAACNAEIARLQRALNFWKECYGAKRGVPPR